MSNGANASSNELPHEMVAVRLGALIGATGLSNRKFAAALAGLSAHAPLAKGTEDFRRMESQRRQIARWRKGETGIEPATALRLVDAANQVLKKERRPTFPLDYLVEVEQPKATLERLDMKLELILAKLESIEERLR